MSIRQLPDNVVDKLQSSSAITSLNAVVVGLLKNALDAGCTKVNIHIDYLHGNCSVQDDGVGIEPHEFKDGGGLGKLHHTSRTPPSASYHGSRGDFLASVANLSLLSIVSHHRKYMSHGYMLVHNSNVLERQIPAPPEKRLEVFSHGTRVSVRCLFGSMPVRVKHRATVFSERSGVDKEWRHVVRQVVTLLLSWPSQVSVSLNETGTRRELRLKSGPNTDMCARISRLLVQAALTDTADTASWVPVSVSNRHARIKGCISTTPVATRHAQLMSLGIRPVLNDDNANVLYESVNKTFANSSFGVVEENDGSDRGPSAKPRKGPDKWPMFYFNISLLGAEKASGSGIIGDVTLEHITMLLQKVCHCFLQKQHLRPRALDRSGATRLATRNAAERSKQSSRLSQVTTPLKSTTSLSGSRPTDGNMPRLASPFSDWHNVKVGVAASKGQLKHLAQGESHSRRLVGPGGKLLRLPFDDDVADDGSSHETQTTGLIDEDLMRQFKRRRVLKTPKSAPSPWLQKVIGSWKNPVFETTQASIPKINEYAAELDSERCSNSRHVNFEAGSISLVGRLSKSALLHAEVIGQVDDKFILMKLPLESVANRMAESNTLALVMVDQHAADERCKLEELMAGYFQDKSGKGSVEAVVEALERPMAFEIADREGEMLQRYHGHFSLWGIHYSVQRGTREQPGTKMRVTRLPRSIVERCLSEPRLMIDLIRKEIWTLEDGNKTCVLRGSDDSGASPTSRFQGCPAGILDLLYSRSCRSAIMFNDKLTRAQCEQLLQHLGQCTFPFQCAHGRPSIAPLADLGIDTRHIASCPDGRPLGVSVWRKWLES